MAEFDDVDEDLLNESLQRAHDAGRAHGRVLGFAEAYSLGVTKALQIVGEATFCRAAAELLMLTLSEDAGSGSVAVSLTAEPGEREADSALPSSSSSRRAAQLGQDLIAATDEVCIPQKSVLMSCHDGHVQVMSAAAGQDVSAAVTHVSDSLDRIQGRWKLLCSLQGVRLPPAQVCAAAGSSKALAAAEAVSAAPSLTF